MLAYDIDKFNTFDIRFYNNCKGNEKYELSIKSFFSETKIQSDILSNGSYKGVKVPDLYPPNSEYVCQISVKKNGGKGNYVAYGDVQFKYDPITKEVEYITLQSFPKNLNIKKEFKDALTIQINYEML